MGKKEPSMKKTWKVLIIVAAAVLVAALVITFVSPDRRRLDDSAREQSGSNFVELSEGFTQYEIAGPPSGEPVVLIHGLSVPMYDWDSQFTALAEAGYRVVRYNQYGRGLSGRPRGPYDSERYVRQLKDLLDSQRWNRANLVAHSMGCAVAAKFAIVYPDSVKKMVLISPVLHVAEGNAGISLARIPVVGDIAAQLILARVLASRADELLVNAGVRDPAPYSEAFREQMNYRGFSRAVKSLFRNDMVVDLSQTYGELDGTNTLAIWGANDESVSTAQFETIANLVPEMEQVILDGIGHAPNMQVPEETNELILSYLDG